jgi:hypothetical protein
MSKEQIADLQAEMSQQQFSDETMLLNYQVRYWKQRAWRAEQQRDREIEERKKLEKSLEKYKCVPQEALDAIRLEIKEKELSELKKEIHTKFGFLHFLKVNEDSQKINTIDGKIKLCKNIIFNGVACDETDSEDSD